MKGAELMLNEFNAKMTQSRGAGGFYVFDVWITSMTGQRTITTCSLYPKRNHSTYLLQVPGNTFLPWRMA